MAAVGFTRVQLREDVARFFAGNKLFQSTVTNTAVGSFGDTKACRYADDYFNGTNLFIKTNGQTPGAAPEGTSSWVVDFASALGVFTCSPFFSPNVPITSTYQVYWRKSKDDIDRALARACTGALAVQALTPSATTLDYDLSGYSGILRPSQVTAVWRRDLNKTNALPYQLQGWQLEDNAGVLELRLPELCNTTDGLWLEYTVGEAGMTTDASMVNLPAHLVKARALVLLLEDMLGQLDSGELQSWGSILREWKEERLRLERAVRAPVGKARRFRWEDTVGQGYSRAEWALGLIPDF